MRSASARLLGPTCSSSDSTCSSCFFVAIALLMQALQMRKSLSEEGLRRACAGTAAAMCHWLVSVVQAP